MCNFNGNLLYNYMLLPPTKHRNTLNEKQTCLSNINALAHYTMMNNEERDYFAVNKIGYENTVRL